jgi:hypothetical protein
VEIGNGDMKIHRVKMMLYSIQSSAGPYKIRPEEGLPASIDKLAYDIHRKLKTCKLNEW